MNIENIAVGGVPLPHHTSLSLGIRHPSTAGVVAFQITTSDDGVITHVRLQPGYLHRAAEKLFEVRDYRALIMLADRHDWLASFSGELVTTLAVENAMGLVPPPRAVWLRTLLAEVARIHSHLSYLSHICADSTVPELWELADALREAVLAWSGNRVHPMLMRVGGVALDMPSGWPHTMVGVLARVEALMERIRADLARRGERFRGLAVTSTALCMGYGLSGPVARAAGLAMDGRRDGVLAYGEVGVGAATRIDGDALARFELLVEDVLGSAEMICRCLDGLPGGVVSVRLSRRLKVPEGEHLSEVEAPWGIAGALLVSRGGQTPWRLSLRTPTFANVSALEELLLGSRKQQIADAVASMGYGIGDLDK